MIIPLLILIGTSIWVFFDAKSIGIQKTGEKAQTGMVQTDMGPAGWAICCLLLWIVAFPLYLYKRPGYKKKFQPGGIFAPTLPVLVAAGSHSDDFEKSAIVSRLIDALLSKLRSAFPPEVCRKHLALFRTIGHTGTLVAGLLGLIIGIIAAIKSDSFGLFLAGIAWLLCMLIIDYISRRFAQVSEHLVSSTKSYLSSSVYIEAIALLVLVASAALFGFGLYTAIKIGDIDGFVKVGAWSVWLFYIGVLTLNAGELLNVEIKKELKAEEEGVGLLELGAKSTLLAGLFYFGSGILFGLVDTIWNILQATKDDQWFAYAAMGTVPYFISIAVIAALPFLACLVFLILYTSIAAVKSLIRIASAVDKKDGA